MQHDDCLSKPRLCVLEDILVYLGPLCGAFFLRHGFLNGLFGDVCLVKIAVSLQHILDACPHRIDRRKIHFNQWCESLRDKIISRRAEHP
ncbi:MAG: hypothetical protein JNK74_10040 [Candidatus Hydrogenedentes bacterium]|nr:hypothetical protein [Candidatus Hydrogenedentota bacterium]